MSRETNHEESEGKLVWFHVLVGKSILNDVLFRGIDLKVKDKENIKSYHLNEDDGIQNKDYISLEVSMSKSKLYTYNYYFIYEDRITQEARDIGRSSINTGQSHVYDGILRMPKCQGSKDVEIAADIFVGQLQIPSTVNGFTGLRGEEIQIRIQDISDSLRHTYWEEWKQPGTKTRFKQAVKKLFEQFFSDTVDRNLAYDHREYIFINAVTIACLLNEGHLILSSDERCLVCKALLPQLKIMDVILKNEKCFNIAILREAFSHTNTKIIKVLYHLIKPMIANQKDAHPAWLYTMPLLHFLVGKYSSFEKHSDSSDHASENTDWWGTSIDGFTIRFQQFKSNRIKSELLEETITDLKEHFKADFLLARTLMACLRFDQLREVVKHEHIPYDAILATLCYYMKTEKNIVQREIDILTCLSRVEMIAKKEIVTQYTDIMSLREIRKILRSSKISFDLLDVPLCGEVTDKIIISTLKAVWMLLHLLHIKVERAEESREIHAIRTDQYQLLAKISEKSRQWMKCRLDVGKKVDLSNWIRNYNKLLTMKVPEGHVMDFLRQIVCAIVSEKLQRKVVHNSIVTSFLKEDCKRQIQDLIECLKSVEEHLLSGKINISDFQTVKNNKTQFFNVLREMPNINLNILKKAFDLREQELNEYFKSLEDVKQFTSLCHRFEVDTSQLDDQIEKFKNIGKFRIEEVCITKSEEAIFIVEVIAFKSNTNNIRRMRDISKNSTSVLFLNFWDAIGKEYYQKDGQPLSINHVLTSVWNDTKEKMQRLKDSLSSGDICFGEFEDICERFTNKEKLRHELKSLEDGPTLWVDTRINQIQMYKEARSCIGVALVILEIVTEFSIVGDFTAIRGILELTEGQYTAMKVMPKNFDQVSKALFDIDKRKRECLQIFLQSKPLVVWLRERMKDNIRDLRMFVDIAYTSIGDDGIDIARITSLQAAASGYAALIFDIPHPCNYDTFLDKCCEVWKAVELTPTLPEQLEDTCRYLDWFKNLEESHRSLHMTSLSQTEAINRNGRFLVGNLTKELNQNNLTRVEVLQLTVEEGHRGRKTQRMYTCEQLNDLQSKLMLVAGSTEKSSAQKDSTERFLEIFEALKNLGDIYSKLLASGCVLFSNCQIEFRCDPNSVVFIFISFGEKNDKHIIRGERQKILAGLEELNDCSFIRKIVEFFEDCLQEWQRFIEGKREKYLLLNNFTIKQLVILQKELANIGKGKDASRMIFPLLSTIRNDCIQGDILDAIHKARNDIHEKESKILVTGDCKKQTLDSQVELVESFISNMVEAGFEEYVALEALKHVQAGDIAEGISWCMVNGDEIKKSDDNGEDTYFQKDECWSTARMLNEIGVDSTKGINTSKKEVLENLQKLWETFLKSTESSVADFLSVEHTAIILDNLAQKGEVFNTVLSLYRQQKNQPLPQPDEVLLCSKETTSDLLDIFLRRSLFSNSNKIYCLLNVDCLTYEVSDKGERLLDRYIQDASIKGSPYQFIVICSSENEFKSRIVAALDKYRRKPLQCGDINIKDYLSYKCRVDVRNDFETASCVDFERSFVRVVKSFRSGVGKTLFVKTMLSTLEKKMDKYGSSHSEYLVSIPIHGKKVVSDSITDVLLQYTGLPESNDRRIFHIDISHEVEEGVDSFLFELLVLGRLVHSSGYMWRRSDLDYYIIESMPILTNEAVPEGGVPKSIHRCLNILPDIVCRSPLESLNILAGNFPDDYRETDLIFNDTEFRSHTYQSTYKYLLYLENVQKIPIKRTKESFLRTFLRHCGVKDPSWSEVFHFVNFLNRQLKDFEKSTFCSANVASFLPGFRLFLLKLIIQMSRDFATRSLEIKEESATTNFQKTTNVSEDNANLALLYHMRKRWETSSHPYVFFNPDGHTMTFLGFCIDPRTLNLIDQKSKRIIEEKFITITLLHGLSSQGVNLEEDFDQLEREKKILKLCTVMGITDAEYDPDPSYELTTDNVKKILAVYMRFRCDIPVVIMGETGCGKTRLVRFMCSLQKGNSRIENMIIMKVHGGTTTADIIRKVRKAEDIAKKNAIEHPDVYTVLFLDEANTTEAIGMIKQIMCDKSLDGKAIKLYEKLKIVAACNPYRRHKQSVIKSLEQAGLGYHVSCETTSDKLGRIPMRQLVYRVQPLPQSMLPLIRDKKLPNIRGLGEAVSRLLSKCQEYMRTQQDECSFVSLRDVERVLQVTSWFQKQNQALNEYLKISSNITEREMSRSLLLAVKVCYESCLKNKDEFNTMIRKTKISPLINDESIQQEMLRCKKMFLIGVGKLKNIAHNQALEENVFLMVICIELRIPLFLVGKPGSSKSLAKTIVADVMQGKHSRSSLFKNYKEVHMVSFQCSPLSRADGIIGTFNQCAEFQKDKDLNKFVSVVVLDEVGLAEDSPRMPLKGKFRNLHDDLNKLRVKFADTKDASLVKIPPCENSFLQHIPCAMLQTQVRMKSHIAKPVIILSKHSGWQEGKNGLLSVFFKGPMSADFLQDLVCTYTCKGKTACSKNCVCNQQNSAYANICSCEGSDGSRNYLTHRAILGEDDDENDD
ncbi:RNF213 [Mytilus coruscus]|uniref:RNF213 n=1 Tax=Mytilus coruscus TaxID=42192 RepID=A0A6J8ECV5_MYTCO|nr:RNF213 [Mytilus coruscus]